MTPTRATTSSGSPINGNWRVSTTSTAITPLVVQTTNTNTLNGVSGQSLSSHTVTFTTALNAVSVDTTRQASGTDGGDTIAFQAAVSSATVLAGTTSSLNPDSVSFSGTVGSATVTTGGGGDTVRFGGSVGGNTTVTTNGGNDSITFSNNLGSNSSVIAGTGNDTIVFATSNVFGTVGKDLVQAGSGSDSIRFSGTTKVGTNITLDFGAGDGSVDTLNGAAKATFQSAGVQIRNFGSGDRVIVAGNTFTTQAQINTYFGDTGQSIRLI